MNKEKRKNITPRTIVSTYHSDKSEDGTDKKESTFFALNQKTNGKKQEERMKKKKEKKNLD